MTYLKVTIELKNEYNLKEISDLLSDNGETEINLIIQWISEGANYIENCNSDVDNDGICDYSDIDDDGDGAADELDAFPFDPTEYSDIDSDGIGNNADDDDDGDGWTDYQENNCISNSQDPNSVPVDSDNDGICDQMESEGTSGLPGFGLISAITMLAFAAFARKE